MSKEIKFEFKAGSWKLFMKLAIKITIITKNSYLYYN